jgi:hypothetical protein
VRRDEVCHRLMTRPGVEPVVADQVALVSALGTALRPSWHGRPI